MFEPISGHRYCELSPDKQLLVCTLSRPCTDKGLVFKWLNQAAAVFYFGPEDDVLDIVRDLLANPQIRAIVFEGHSAGREKFAEFWRNTEHPECGIAESHLSVVRQFVDLYDGDCHIKGALPPYWPTRLKYLKETVESSGSATGTEGT